MDYGKIFNMSLEAKDIHLIPIAQEDKMDTKSDHEYDYIIDEYVSS